ncbi:ATP-binding protein [Aquiflexum gelatinilyticum]|uniref:ATP-binding protein n=1 Tax=Aquiflexum gelatinilyticum TaxID=2961943 RepID=UPI002169796B|nr:AAA family ATPase [Aquiflexum gelatinilyticum]MCS4436014.1 AAA family ATPase [Aquiflexum gelatinilyticum]
MSFNRQIFKHLEYWKNNKQRKPLIIRGARQVGKTTLVKDFAKTYPNSILLNLEKLVDKSFFEDLNDVKSIQEALFLSNNINAANLGKTLLFLDEIQESPKAIQLLRYFYEEMPELHVIAAGSLLEFAMKEVKSFPVGRVEFLYLHPMNFPEYLEAVGHSAALEQFYQVPIKPFAHKVLMELFHRYAIIGGMPEIIKTEIQKTNLASLPQIYESIWGTYKNDVEKYTSNNTERKIIKHIMDFAPLTMDQRVKFQGFGNSTYKSREVGECFRILEDARLLRLIYPTTDVVPPIQYDVKKSPRIQILDTGLTNYTIGIQSQLLGMDDLSNAYKGALVPHLVTQELISIQSISDKKPNFWVREKNQSSAEVDLVFTHKNKVIPIEIKSGPTGSLRSLHQFIDASNHPFAVRIYGGEFKIEETKTPGGKPYYLMNLPYYLGTRIKEFIEWFVQRNG